ncbi:MAG TPA: SDR family NAD(P)-dependent oxidoreductase [Burkholderiales bacterium]|jgi:NAD(P)-dependent dehydrogenase (short-subunit alcohol dehydrogenase family)|nr:SDR family NAD(P)-dependent oxidoreductase [Burkholderiales bacterium]
MTIALIGGAGEGLGAALGRRFAKGGLEVVLSSRTQGEKADLREEAQVIDLFDRVEKRGPVQIAVFNAGANFRSSILDTPAEMFEKIWRLGCYAGFLFGREAARRMMPRGRGTILFTGATASVRGSAQFAAFAAAKGGLRQVAQSMARELGPRNIHVAHVVIDGVIDNRRSRERMADYVKSLPADGLLATDAIAELFWQIHVQPRSAWTFEADLRPWAEKF